MPDACCHLVATTGNIRALYRSSSQVTACRLTCMSQLSCISCLPTKRIRKPEFWLDARSQSVRCCTKAFGFPAPAFTLHCYRHAAVCCRECAVLSVGDKFRSWATCMSGSSTNHLGQCIPIVSKHVHIRHIALVEYSDQASSLLAQGLRAVNSDPFGHCFNVAGS